MCLFPCWDLNIWGEIVGNDSWRQKTTVAILTLIVNSDSGQWNWWVRYNVLNIDEGHRSLGGILDEARVGEFDELVVTRVRYREHWGFSGYLGVHQWQSLPEAQDSDGTYESHIFPNCCRYLPRLIGAHGDPVAGRLRIDELSAFKLNRGELGLQLKMGSKHSEAQAGNHRIYFRIQITQINWSLFVG